MKKIENRLIPLLKKGHCTAKIVNLARTLKEPTTTIQYNIKKMEKEGKIKSYKAVFDHSKIEEGFCGIALVSLNPENYKDPETTARRIAKNPEIESVDICTGDWELIVKLRAKNQEEYFDTVKLILSGKEILKVTTLVSLKQIKSEFVEL